MAFEMISVAILLALSGKGATAATPIEVANDKRCENLADDAEMAMKFRQDRTLMRKVLELNEKVSSPALAKVLDDLTVRAYATPAFLTPELKVQAIAEFRAKILLDCVKGPEQASVPLNDMERIDALVGEQGRAAFIRDAVSKLLNSKDDEKRANCGSK